MFKRICMILCLCYINYTVASEPGWQRTQVNLVPDRTVEVGHLWVTSSEVQVYFDGDGTSPHLKKGETLEFLRVSMQSSGEFKKVAVFFPGEKIRRLLFNEETGELVGIDHLGGKVTAGYR